MRLADDPIMKDPNATILAGDRLNPFSCPILPALSARVFISYARSSAKGSRLAGAIHAGLKKEGVLSYLDRVSNPTGASWKKALHHHLGDCDVFLCILDEKSVQREWVAVELLAALNARRQTGLPDIWILIDPVLQHSDQPILPVFQGIISASNQAPIEGRPQILQLNAQTQAAIVWALAPGRYLPAAIFTRLVALPIMFVMSFFALIGGLGIVTGFILGFFALIEASAKFPFSEGLAARGLVGPMTLLTAFSLGSMARGTIAWGHEIDHGREMGPTTPAIATIGLACAFGVLVPKVSALLWGWSFVLVVAGWLLLASVGQSARNKARIKIDGLS
jgi:hypothetical protein